MHHILLDQISRIRISDMDDVIIYSSNFEQHLEDIKAVFDTIKAAQLKVKLSKCKFVTMGVEFLAHLVFREGIYPNKRNIIALTTFPEPQTTKDVRAFLSLCMFYRKFTNYRKPIHDYQYIKELQHYRKRNTGNCHSFWKIPALLARWTLHNYHQLPSLKMAIIN